MLSLLLDAGFAWHLAAGSIGVAFTGWTSPGVFPDMGTLLCSWLSRVSLPVPGLEIVSHYEGLLLCQRHSPAISVTSGRNCAGLNRWLLSVREPNGFQKHPLSSALTGWPPAEG